MNRFQEALDIVNERFDYMNEELHPNKHYQKPQISLDTLQELIDNYSKFNEDKSCQYLCDTKALLEEELSIVKERLSITEKALDKACELNIKQRFGKDYLYIPNDIVKQKENELKERLLKESEKQ